MNVLSRAIALVTLLCGAAFGAEGPAREPVAREPSLGFAGGVVLARPHAAYREMADAAEPAERLRVRKRFARFGDLRVLELPAGESVESALERLRATGRYEFVEPDYVMALDATPSDPGFGSQWAFNNTGQLAGSTSGADIKAVAAWDIVREAPNVIVAVVDTGVRLDHQDLVPNLWVNPSPTFGDINGAAFIRGVRSGRPNDEHGHGTHVAGIIGAAANNGVATAGVAWRVQLMILKNSGSDGFSAISDSAACIDYAIAHGATIINCSFGGTSFSQTMFAAIRAAREAGVIVVTAAGNSAVNNDLMPHYPSNFLADNVVSVGSSTPSDTVSASSNYGTTVELFAPGSSILSLSYASTTGTLTTSGTSMSAPMVTGAFALLKARFPSDKHRQLINRLLRGAEVKTAFAGRAQSNGRLNVLGALTTTTNRPFNDDFANRAAIGGSVVSLRTNNSGALTEAGEPRINGASPDGSLWWVWSATTTGTIGVDTSGSEYDTMVAVYPGSAASVSTLVPIVANDDAPSLRTSRVTLPVVAGNSYIISIAGKGGANGYTQLNIAPAQGGDVFTNPIRLAGESAKSTARNNFAGGNPADPRILGQSGGASIWHQWTAPRSGPFQVSAFSSDFDPLLAVYTGTELGNLAVVAANDDTDPEPGIANNDSRCSIFAVGGTAYYIQVDTKNAGTRGTFTLTVTDSIWQLSAGGEITGSPAAGTDGTLYFGTISPDSRIYAVGFDGTLKWSHAVGGGIDRAAPAVGGDGTIYLGSLDGKLNALRPDGTLRWQRDLGGLPAGVSVSPTIGADGTVYVHANDGYLYAFAPADGSVRWRLDVGATATSASAIIAADGTIYQGSNDQNFYAINPNGTLKWRYVAGGDILGTPALDVAGNVYAATNSTGRLFSLTPSGSHRWSYNAGGVSNTVPIALSTSPALSGDGTTVYIGTGDRRMHAVNTTSGSARWTYTAGDGIVGSSPAVDSNGVIYFGANDGKIYALNPNGALKRTWDSALGIQSSPAILGSTLYIGSRDAKLYALDIGAFVSPGPWPMYRHNARRTGRVIADPPGFGQVLQSQTAIPGERVLFSAAAVGQGELTYQWAKDGVAIPGATAATYTISTFTPVHAGSYRVTVTGAQGVVTSAAAALTVARSNTGRLVNLSILADLTAADPRFTVGMVVGGAGVSGTKPILLRAAGPSLAPLGVTTPLDDPRLELFAGQTAAGGNDDWGGGAALTAIFDGTGAFRFGSVLSKDAAIYSPTLAAGNYTLQVSGVAGATGTVLAELYDATPDANYNASTPRLINVSVLKQVGAGGTLTAGFVLGGSSPKQVLIRAVGPTLAGAPFGVSGVLADPKIDLYRGAERIDGNDDWGGGAALAATFGAVGAFPLVSDGKDAALLVTLAPGPYSAQVTGAGGGGGMTLVEVYEVP